LEPNRREFLKTLGIGAAALTVQCASPGQGKAAVKPNILFIMTDDHAAQAIGCYGSRINATPNIDRLAAGGVRFDQAFCTNSICAPSRAVLLTGKHSHMNGLIDNSATFDGSQQTFPKLLQQAGYETALFGKWHLKSDPTGFDYWKILPGQGSYYNPDFIEMGERKNFKGYATDLTTDDCLAWLKQRKGDRPFCALLHHKAPHRNWMPPPKYLDLYEGEEIPAPETLFDDYATRSDAAREQEMSIAEHFYPAYDLKWTDPDAGEPETGREKADRRMWGRIYGRLDDVQRAAWDEAYGPRNAAVDPGSLSERERVLWQYQRYIKDYLRCIASVDENIGRVLDYLDRSGLADNTLVVYTSDQGFYLGEHGWYDKRFMYEESLRIPLVMRYPGRIAAGTRNRDLVQNLDFAPTFLDLAGVDVPGDMQGASLRPVLRGATPEDWRQSIYYHYYEYPAVHAVKRHYGVRTARYKLIHFYHDIDAWELFDLKEDPTELNNVYGDPAYATVRKMMHAELERLRALYKDNSENAFMPKQKKKRKHKALGCPVRLKHPCSPKYTGGGPNALTDGIMSPKDPGGLPDYGIWQGFEENDLEAVVDLGKKIPVQKVSAGFLQHVSAWIFLPVSVQIATSNDGETFSPAEVIKHDIPQKREGAIKKTFEQKFGKTEARFVRVRAKSVGTCPDWHQGAGGKAWIFADEIVVE
jgi:arylsulfatase A-like enzyme